jgi:acetoin utilization deacetylase AcuC-like enzyme
VPDALRQIGLVYDERCLAHRNPPGGVAFGALPAWAPIEAFERPERLSLTLRVLEGSGALAHLERIPAREASEAELALVHAEAHVRRVLDAAARRAPTCLGPDAWTGPGTREAALLAAGGALAAVDAVLAGGLDGALALVRPPGHHAERDAPMGFCLFNNVALAARWAQRAHGLERVAILDWDVHHGNGTEEIFYADGSVLCASLHQAGLYPPHTGGLEARGEGPGEGANVNVPLPAGTGDAGYLHALERVVEPLVRAFRPELLLVAAGQDASATDPLGRMSLTVPGFRALADRAVALADATCGGRLVAVLEGGYSLQHVPLANLAIVEGLAGLPPTFDADPVGVDAPAGVRDEERTAVDAAALAHGAVPR